MYLAISLCAYFINFFPIDQRSVVKALACYQCNSVKDPECSGTSLDKFKTECKDGAVGCRKMHYLCK